MIYDESGLRMGRGTLLSSLNACMYFNQEFFCSVSTLEPSCLEDYTTAQEVVPYFETVVQLFQQLDTYQALTSAGVNINFNYQSDECTNLIPIERIDHSIVI